MVRTIVGILFLSLGLSQAPSSLNKKIDKLAKSVEKKSLIGVEISMNIQNYRIVNSKQQKRLRST